MQNPQALIADLRDWLASETGWTISPHALNKNQTLPNTAEFVTIGYRKGANVGAGNMLAQRIAHGYVAFHFARDVSETTLWTMVQKLDQALTGWISRSTAVRDAGPPVQNFETDGAEWFLNPIINDQNIAILTVIAEWQMTVLVETGVQL